LDKRSSTTPEAGSSGAPGPRRSVRRRRRSPVPMARRSPPGESPGGAATAA